MPRQPTPTVSLDAQVSIPDSTLFQELSGELVLLNLNTGTYFGLDPTGTRIWQLLQTHRSLQQALRCLLDEFDVDDARARADLLALVSELCAQGLLEVASRSGAEALP